jgi:hypothetical protein
MSPRTAHSGSGTDCFASRGVMDDADLQIKAQNFKIPQ